MRRMEEELDGERIEKLWKSISIYIGCILVSIWTREQGSKRMVEGGQQPWSNYIVEEEQRRCDGV